MLFKLLATTVVLLASIPHGLTQSLNEPCTNPHGQPGRCVFLRECQPLLDIYRRDNVSYDESEFFYGSRCSGQFEGKPLLCCFPAPANSSASLPRAPSDCGLAPPERIVGGHETTLGEFPWMALLMYRDTRREIQLSCAATLINSRYLVTAAHCIKQVPAELTLSGVRLGEHDITNKEERDCDQQGCADVPVEVGIEKVIVHEQYNATERGQYNDIALIRLDRDVGFSDYIDPVCLPVEDSVRKMDHTGMKAVAAGWGYTETDQRSNVKLKVTLDVLDHKKCVDVYRSSRVALRDTQLCAGGKEGKDTCRGDSGGPLMRSVDGNYYLIGVISWGAAQCGTKGIPALYTNVAMFVDWIENHLE
ncbi:hypothetical protein quinque_007367 [Culex quinquefasciatus]